MDEPNIESLILRSEDFKEGSNKQHLANMLQSQGIDLYPNSSAVYCKDIIFEQTSLGFEWQSDGNACGNVVIEGEHNRKDYSNIKSKILLERYYIENKELKSYKKEWSNICLRGGFHAPFFHGKEKFSFYAGGLVDQKQQVLGYTIYSDGEAVACSCVLQYKKGTSSVMIPLSTLENETFLLQDILRSPSSLILDENGESIRVFKVEDILFSNERTKWPALADFWFFDWILHWIYDPVKKSDALYEEVVFPDEQKEGVFDAEEYFADKKEFVEEKDDFRDIRRALKMAMWHQCLYEKVNKLVNAQ
jgi:hypothetical protein